LHWNSEKETLYSDIAFAKLSQKFKIEKSVCVDKGISLVYKNLEPECEHAGVVNIYVCSLQPHLLLASCEGAEYRLFGGSNIKSSHEKENVALEKLQSKLKDESFWNEWEQGIKQWSPQCE
jgi:hypothetical protein